MGNTVSVLRSAAVGILLATLAVPGYAEVEKILVWGDDEIAVTVSPKRGLNRLYTRSRESHDWVLLDDQVEPWGFLTADASPKRRVAWNHAAGSQCQIWYAEVTSAPNPRRIHRLPVGASDNRSPAGLLSPGGHFIAVRSRTIPAAIYDFGTREVLARAGDQWFSRKNRTGWAWAADDSAVAAPMLLGPGLGMGRPDQSWWILDTRSGDIRTVSRFAEKRSQLFWCEPAGGFAVLALPDMFDPEEGAFLRIMAIETEGDVLPLPLHPDKWDTQIETSAVSQTGRVVAIVRELEAWDGPDLPLLQGEGLDAFRDFLAASAEVEVTKGGWQIILWRFDSGQYHAVRTWETPVADKPRIGVDLLGQTLAIAAGGSIAVVETETGAEMWRCELPE